MPRATAPSSAPLPAPISLRAELPRFLLTAAPLWILAAWLYASFDSQADMTVFFRLRRFANPEERKLIRLVTDLGNVAMYAVWGGILIHGLRARRKELVRAAVVYVVAQLLITFILVRVLKIAIGRPRPGQGLLFVPWSLEPIHHSLPSGHTAEFTGATVPMALALGGWLWPLGCVTCGLLVALMGFSRVYLGEHHMDDVLFGWSLGCASALAIRLLGLTGRLTWKSSEAQSA